MSMPEMEVTLRCSFRRRHHIEHEDEGATEIHLETDASQFQHIVHLLAFPAKALMDVTFVLKEVAGTPTKKVRKAKPGKTLVE